MSDRTQPTEVVGVPFQAPSNAFATSAAYRHTDCATDKTFALSRGSGAPPPISLPLALAELQPAEASLRYPPVSLVSKPSLTLQFAR